MVPRLREQAVEEEGYRYPNTDQSTVTNRLGSPKRHIWNRDDPIVNGIVEANLDSNSGDVNFRATARLAATDTDRFHNLKQEADWTVNRETFAQNASHFGVKWG